ncbi:hypothetical protein BJX76DRAFT_153797 [Aspergillus varians]
MTTPSQPYPIHSSCKPSTIRYPTNTNHNQNQHLLANQRDKQKKRNLHRDLQHPPIHTSLRSLNLPSPKTPHHTVPYHTPQRKHKHNNDLPSRPISAPEPSVVQDQPNIQPKRHLHCPHGINHADPQVSRRYRHSKKQRPVALGLRISASAAPFARGVEKPTCFLDAFFIISNFLILNFFFFFFFFFFESSAMDSVGRAFPFSCMLGRGYGGGKG